MKYFTLSVLALSALAVGGCSEQSQTALEPDQAVFAQPGSGGGGGSTTVTDPVATFYLPALQGSLGLWGDGKSVVTYASSSMSEYLHQVCGVETRFFYTGSGDAILNSNGHSKSASKCKDAPRTVRVAFQRIKDDGTLESQGTASPTVFLNAFDVQDTTSADGTGPIKVGPENSEQRPVHINMGSNTIYPCDALRFRPVLDNLGGVVTGADLVTIERVNSKTWRVYSTPDGNGHHKAACVKNDKFTGLYHVPVDYYIVTDRDLP